MLIQVFPLMVLELLICVCQTSRLTYFLSFSCLVSVLETLYTAYYAIGLLAYSVALISHLPFIVSLLRMLYRDTEARRLIFYRTCCRLWVFTFAIDMWVFLNVAANVDEQCELTGFFPDEQILAQHFNVSSIDLESLLFLCRLRVQVHFAFCLMCYHG